MRDSYTLYEDKLQGEYKEVFQQIDTYFGTEKVDEDTREEQMGELLDVFLLAQEEGRPVEKITGKNLESFCKAFCSGLSWKQRILNVFDLVKSISWFVFAMSVLIIIPAFMERVRGEQINIWELQSDINIFGYVCGFLIVIFASVIVAFVTRKIMFKVKKISMRIWEFAVNGIAILSFLAMMVFCLRDSTFDVPAWIAFLGSGMYLALYYIFNNKRIKVRKEHEVKFWDEVKKDVSFDANMENLFSEQMEKKWEKKNRKLLKKGKPSMTRAEILDAEEAECLKTEKQQWLNWVIPIPVIVMAVLLIDFETKTDMYWFAGIIFVIEYVLMALLWKAANSGLVNRRKWIEAERKKLETQK